MIPALIAAGAAALPALINAFKGDSEEDKARKAGLKKMLDMGALKSDILDPGADLQSQMAGVAIDPETRAAQMQALRQLSGDASAEGLTDSEKLVLGQIDQQNGQREKANRQAIMSQFQARGMGGSGTEALSQLINQQSSANNQNAQGMQAAAMAQSRKMQALQGLMSGGSTVRGQDFGEAAARAQAADAMASFNANRRDDSNKFNINRKADDFAQNLNLANAQTGSLNQAADATAAATQRTGNMLAGAGAGAIGMIQGQEQINEARRKNDLEERKAAQRGY